MRTGIADVLLILLGLTIGACSNTQPPHLQFTGFTLGGSTFDNTNWGNIDASAATNATIRGPWFGYLVAKSAVNTTFQEQCLHANVTSAQSARAQSLYGGSTAPR